MIAGHLSDFKDSQRLLERIADYGLETTQIRPLVAAWAKQETERLRNATTHTKAAQILALEGWDEKSIRQSLIGGPEGNTFIVEIEAKMTRRFVRFASQSDMVSEQSRRHLTTLLDTTDMTRIIYSSPWLPARQTSRQFHLHIGPTNSGKTYNALKALSKAETGAYAGPLRLLAHEVWERINLGSVGELNGVGRKCNLITGEEKRIVAPDAGLVSCTVEMLPASGPSNEPFDVVVIDEIQMIGDSSRGGAWTAALMGVQAKEIHLCGDETTLELLQELLPSMGDEIQIHRYERLTPLRVAEESLGGDISKVGTGDCVVTFSRNNIFAVKQQIESGAAKKCAVIYGALPPEVRADQAKIFNEDEGIAEVLVASDAVGMGLNL
jgi:ATP-dependent RNA helicase SUPV3L1/SUV3